MNVLAIDVGGTHVKILATGQNEARKFASGPRMTVDAMVAGVKVAATGWRYDVVAIGYPGAVVGNRPIAEPHNLARGWVGFDYEAAFGRPVKIINDAAIQALGSYRGGKLLFLGLGTGLGSALIVDGVVVPMELAHLPYKQSTFEDHVGAHALQRDGTREWRKNVDDVIVRLAAAMLADDVVLGGGNARLLKDLPPGCRLGDNANAFAGGFRLWDGARPTTPARRAKQRSRVPGPPQG